LGGTSVQVKLINQLKVNKKTVEDFAIIFAVFGDLNLRGNIIDFKTTTNSAKLGHPGTSVTTYIIQLVLVLNVQQALYCDVSLTPGSSS
jgi:hypothetical protein